jgi:hypothetical protein
MPLKMGVHLWSVILHNSSKVQYLKLAVQKVGMGGGGDEVVATVPNLYESKF